MHISDSEDHEILHVDMLVLGAGWTSTFLIPLCLHHNISYAATTRSGQVTHPIPDHSTAFSEERIKFDFDPMSDDPDPFRILPDTKTVLITFPIKVSGASERFVRLFKKTHPGTNTVFIQLGSTGIWDGGPTVQKSNAITWFDRHSPFDESNERARAEMELLALSPETATTVLDLCGLWGGARDMRNWVGRVAPTKDVLRNKTSIHMIHGLDVARAIIAVHNSFGKASGQRWMLTDCRVYDWWDLASAWGTGGDGRDGREGPQPQWVGELMEETGVRALPRSPEALGRALDGREFWTTFGLSPSMARLERE